MMKHCKTCIVIFFLLYPTFAFSEIVELVPCNYLFKNMPQITKLHKDEMQRIFLKETKVDLLNPIFIMLYSPAFDPEYLLVIYHDYPNKKYIAEYIIAKKSIWSLMWDIFHSNKGVWPDDPNNIRVSVGVERKKKDLPSDTASKIGRISNTLLSRAIVPKVQINKNKPQKTYLDGPIIIYYSAEGSCGFCLGHFEGNAKSFLELSLLLKKYISNEGISLKTVEKETNSLYQNLSSTK